MKNLFISSRATHKFYLILKSFSFITFLFFTIPSYSQQNWVLTNGPYGGESVYDIIEDADGNLYIGTATGGVYKSIDYGRSWIKKNGGMGNRFVKALALSQSNSLFAATGPWSDGRIYKSTDLGENWNQVFYTSSGVYSLAVGLNGWIYAGSWGDGIFISTDDGITWNQYNLGLLNTRINAVYFKEGFVFANTDGGGVSRSTNGGIEWEPVNTGLPIDSNGWIFAKSFSIKSNGDILVNTGQKMYQTTNNGDNWIFISSIGTNRMIFNYSDVLYASFWSYRESGGLKRSYDDGITWEELGLQGISVISFLLDGDSSIYAGTLSGGLYKYDVNSNWRKIFNSGSIPVRTEALEISGDELIFAGTRDWGLFYSSNFGDDWIKTGLPNIHVENITFARNGFIYAGYLDVYRSTDNGQTFELVSDKFIRSIYTDKVDNIYISTHYDGLLKSTDYGDTWEVWVNFGTNAHVGDMIQVGENSFIVGYLTADEGPGGPYYSYHTMKTIDNGISWQSISNNMELRGFLMGEFGRLYAHSDANIYTSTNKGDTWEQMNVQPFGGYAILSIRLDSSNVFFATKYDRIFKTSDLGATWIEIPGNGNAWSIKNFLPVDSVIFACNNDGVYKRDQDIITFIDDTNHTNQDFSFDLHQNYPNPFNPATSIQYAISSRQFVTIKIYDLLGKEVATLVNKEKPAGEYVVEFNAANLPSGIYFYRIQAGSYLDTKKMVLLR